MYSRQLTTVLSLELVNVVVSKLDIRNTKSVCFFNDLRTT